jgi:DNA-binding LacI/PurR family transcriptional regulator
MYRAIGEELRRDIQTRDYPPGERLPSDAELATRFDTSRLTVIRALRDLEVDGLVERKAGSGTFVRSAPRSSTNVFGLLMPDLGDGEVFEPIARAIARAGESVHQSLLWGDPAASGPDKEKQAEDLCRYLIARKVSGVFFSPVELTPNQDEVNRRISRALDEAGIPVVLLDRCFYRFPERSRYDLVGIDNRLAGFRMTMHMIKAGCKRVAFAFRPGSASTVEARYTGYQEAIRRAGSIVDPVLKFEAEGADLSEVSRFLKVAGPDGIVCANDFTAARLMPSLLKLGVRIPEDVAMVGINDVKYASFLPVPLTTLRQPCLEIGATAMSVLLDRLKRPDMPARDVLLECEIVVRQSCGTGNWSETGHH